MRMKFLTKSILMATASFVLAACAGNAPRPATEGEAPAGDTVATAPEAQQGEAVFVSTSLDSYRSSIPPRIPARQAP